uniref:Uncharacterized protein n=1 Tax=Colacium vesiculosum TaxID=102910 RepID=J3JR53_9EUGL|nr:hypothetical protein [Colacium vesiculosum]
MKKAKKALQDIIKPKRGRPKKISAEGDVPNPSPKPRGRPRKTVFLHIDTSNQTEYSKVEEAYLEDSRDVLSINIKNDKVEGKNEVKEQIRQDDQDTNIIDAALSPTPNEFNTIQDPFENPNYRTLKGYSFARFKKCVLNINTGVYIFDSKEKQKELENNLTFIPPPFMKL